LLCAFTKGQEEVGFNTILEVSKDLQSNGYWNETDRVIDSNQNNKELEAKHDKASQGISMRLESLEKSVEKFLSGSEHLSNSIKILEDRIAIACSDNESKRISEVFERLVEKMVYRVMVKIADDDMLAELSGRLSKLKGEVVLEGKAIKLDNAE
jgi:hypothetical protein